MAHAKSTCVTTHVHNVREPAMTTYRSKRVAGMGTIPQSLGEKILCLEVWA
jgi:hypothetical protein